MVLLFCYSSLQLKWDYTANSNFLSSHEHQNWTLAQSSVVHVLGRETPAETRKECIEMQSTHACALLYACVSVNVCADDRGSLSRDFPPPRSIITQPTDWEQAGAERGRERKRAKEGNKMNCDVAS